MIAKCSRCQNTFTTERYGRQFCPTCGAEVLLPAPGEEPSAGAAPDPFVSGQPGYGAPPPPGGGGDYMGLPQDQDAPWDRRSELGIGSAFIETWKGTALSPGSFFARLKVEDTTSAFFYAWICAAFGGFFGQLWNILIFEVAAGARPEPAAIIGRLIGAPIGAAIGVWIAAGIVHLGCMLFKCSERGFPATFRAVAYAQGPALLQVIPVIGMLGGFWTLVIQVFALSRMQRTTTGKAAAAILVPILALTVCCCGIIAAAVGAGIGAAGLSRGHF